MKKNEERIKKYLAVWDAITSWIVLRLSQKEELSTAEVKHLAEIQEKIQKSSEVITGFKPEESKSSLEVLAKMIEMSRKKYE